MRLNLGCGANFVEGWINVDYALGARLTRLPIVGPLSQRFFNARWDRRVYLHDLTKPLPWRNEEVDCVYSSHTLEHLSRQEGAAFVLEAHRVLKRGGVLRLVVPDLGSVVRRYQAGTLPADHFVEALGVLPGQEASGFKKVLAPWVQFPHKCMYDTPALVQLVHSAGFAAQARGALESNIADVQEIELIDRTVDAVIVEGLKP